MENLDPNTQPIPDQAAVTTPQPTQTISAAQLAANRSNAQKSTGPRTPQGKLRSASNSMKHGLYSLTNYLDQFEPVTPTEVGLFHAEAHGLVKEEFHLEESQLLVNELVDEADFGWGNWLELIEVVGDHRQCDVVVMDEAIEVGE